jgi:hypothetical protein
LLWQDVRMDIMFDVLAHPEHAPSLAELEHANGFTDPAELRFQASMLVEYGVLERVTYEGDDAPEDAPRTFYTLTTDGWAVVRHFNDQFSADVYDRLSAAYERVIESAPEYIQNCGDAPRPTGGPTDTDV